MNQSMPSEAVFADGRNARPLALHPDAIGVTYATRPAKEVRAAQIVDGVAVLSIDGPLEHRAEGGYWSYWQTYEDLARDFKSVLDDGEVRAVILKFDTPGGECAGLNETVAIMQRMKAASGKPVIAYVDEACYSAGYALAMVADEIYLPESGGVGSIGVITAMADITVMNEKQGIRVEVIASGTKKTDGHPCVPLSEGAIKRTRKQVDKLASSFFDLVAEGRGMSRETVAGFQAGTFSGQAAVDAGLADGIMSLADCLQFAPDVFTSTEADSLSSNYSEKEPMSRKLAAAKALADATAALTASTKKLAAAKTDSDRALCAARVLAAEVVVAKVTKTKTVTTDTHEEEVDDGKEEAEFPEDDEGDDEDEDEDEEAMGDDEEEKAAKPGASLTKAAKATSILAFARKLTGKQSVDAVMGAMQAMADTHRRGGKLAAEVATLKADAQAAKLSSLIATGMKAGKLAPSQKAWARTQSPTSLQSYLDAAPKMVHTVEDEHTEAKVEGAQNGSVTAAMAKIWSKQGFAEKDFPALLAKMNGTTTMNGAS